MGNSYSIMPPIKDLENHYFAMKKGKVYPGMNYQWVKSRG